MPCQLAATSNETNKIERPEMKRTEILGVCLLLMSLMLVFCASCQQEPVEQDLSAVTTRPCLNEENQALIATLMDLDTAGHLTYFLVKDNHVSIDIAKPRQEELADFDVFFLKKQFRTSEC